MISLDLSTVIAIAVSIGSIFAYHWSKRRAAFARRYSTYMLSDVTRTLLHPYKKRLFAHLRSTALSQHSQRPIRILEIGFGPAANLQFYPLNCSVIGIDVNPYFKQYAEEEMKKSPDVNVEKVIYCSAENMIEHIPDNSIEIVVGTYVFCSIPDRIAALNEIKRVLVQGGKYFFLEHVINNENSFIAMLQKILAPFWFYVMDGCHINRQFLPLLTNAGFSSVENISKFVLDSMWFMVNPTEMGIAIK